MNQWAQCPNQVLDCGLLPDQTAINDLRNRLVRIQSALLDAQAKENRKRPVSTVRGQQGECVMFGSDGRCLTGLSALGMTECKLVIPPQESGGRPSEGCLP